MAWDNGEKENLSPWDLEALDLEASQIPDGDPVSKEELTKGLYTPSSEEWNAMGRESEVGESRSFSTVLLSVSHTQ